MTKALFILLDMRDYTTPLYRDCEKSNQYNEMSWVRLQNTFRRFSSPAVLLRFHLCSLDFAFRSPCWLAAKKRVRRNPKQRVSPKLSKLFWHKKSKPKRKSGKHMKQKQFKKNKRQTMKQNGRKKRRGWKDRSCLQTSKSLKTFWKVLSLNCKSLATILAVQLHASWNF